MTVGFLNVRIYLNLSVISTKCENLTICYHPPESIQEPQNNQVDRMTLLVDISNLSMTTAGWHVVLQSKGPTVLMHVEAHTMAQAFEKRKSFTARSTGKKTGGRAQICLQDLRTIQTFPSE